MSDDANDNPGFDTDIAVVGMAGRFAGARNLAEYWNNLRSGIESLTTFTDEELLAAGVDPALLADPNYVRVGAVMPDMEQFDAGFFGFNAREASIMDPQHRHFLECSWEALENAGHAPDTFKGSIGVFGGSGHNAYMPYNLMTNPKLMKAVGFFLVRHTGNDKDFLTTRVSYLLNLKGPSVNVQTACSTSLVAIHTGVQSLLNRECDMALAGGVTIEMPHRHGYLYQEGEILSPDGHCHAFDADSQGTVFGSGCGVVALRRLADALKDGDHIHAVIKGSAINNDGSGKVSYLAPSVDGQAQAIAEALTLADVSADTVTYVEAHGTGTPVGDPIEIAALTQAFRQTSDGTGYCGIGSVKSNIGHTDTAAGVASFMKVALAMQHKELPPSLHFKSPNPACDFDKSPFYVNHTLKAWTPPAGVPRRAGVSSLGVGGTNAHIVLEEAPRRGASGPSRPWQLLQLSAKTQSALDANTAALVDHLKANPNLNLADAAHTLRVGRQGMKLRRVVAVRDVNDAITALTHVPAPKEPVRVHTETALEGTPRAVAFMFAGGGAQHPNMGLDLYRTEPVFKAAVDECLAILMTQVKTDIRPVLFPAEGQEAAAAEQFGRPSLALPALLTIQYAQAKLWMSWGIQPSGMIGHSMGEYTAAHLAGVFSLADALTIVELRGRLFETLPEGTMLSVPLSEAEVLPLIKDVTPELSISVINGPKMTVVGGPVAAIEALQAKLAEQEIEAARVRINVAAHSSMLEPILKEFGAFFQGIKMKAPMLPFVSNLSGTWITAAEATDPQYWVRHLRNTVRFADGLQELLKDDTRVLLEVGPGRTMASLARQHPGRSPQQPVLNSMRHPDERVDDQAYVLGVLGRLWGLNTAIDWDKFQGKEKRLRIELPTYRFDHQRHWVEPGKGAGVVAAADRSLHKRKDVASWFYQPVWRRMDAATAIEPADTVEAKAKHTLVFADASPFTARLIERLQAAGQDVSVVRAAKTYRREDATRYTINPSIASDYDKLLAALVNDGRAPMRIVHAWMLTGAAKPASVIAGAKEIQELGFYSLLRLAQAMGREDIGGDEDLHFAVLSDKLQRVTTEIDLVPAKATLLGPVKVLPKEFGNLRCTSIDIEQPAPGSRQESLLIDALLRDIATPTADDVLAYRAGQRWAQVYESAPLAEVSAGSLPRLREQGVYLITGGLGGVGLALAEHLAKKVKARLVLVGRSGLPERAQWPTKLAQAASDPATARRIRQVMALESLGAEVMVCATDVADLAQMRASVRQARSRFGAVHGVLHTAGVLADGVAQMKEASTAASVLAPKLQGTLVIEEAIAEAKIALDFTVLFSSISSFAGLAGQVDYAAANAFLDAYAQQRFATDSGYTVAVNWSQWAEVGMAAELAHQLGLAGDDIDESDATPIGHPLVDRCLLDTAAERVYTTRYSRRTHWLLEEHQVLGGEALIPGTGYLEIVRTAFTQATARAPRETGAVELRNVTFLAPFAVKAGEQKDLRVKLRLLRDSHDAAAASGDWSFSVVSRAVDHDGKPVDVPWAENVRGSVARIDGTAPTAEAAAKIAARCTLRSKTFDGTEHPEHLLFGPRWSNMRRIDFGSAEALISLELPADFVGDLTDFPLHPALMDMATAGAQSLIPGFDEREHFYVPASYGSLKVYGPLTPTLASHVRLKRDEDSADDDNADLAVYDVTLQDDQGRVVVDIHDFTMIRVRDKALLAKGADEAPAPAAAPKPKAIANQMLAAGLRDGLRTAEGADVLERVLAWGGGPQVAVSPVDLEAFLAQLNKPALAETSHASSGEVAEGWKAPTTATEKLIAQLWGELLGVDRVGAGDNFFDLGGHSLLAVQVINKLKKKTGKPLALTALLEAPTVETLAALIDPEGSAAGGEVAAGEGGTPVAVPAKSRTLIPIRPGGDKLPIYFIHDGNGETLLYRTLALQLQEGHPIYGLQPEMRPDGSFVQTRIVDWAAAHIEQIRRVQPHGPYLLTGLCAGGVIAFEMARQLQDAGERTLFVGIIDAADVHAEERRFHVAQARLQRFLGSLGEEGDSTLTRLGKAVPTMIRKTHNLVRYEMQSRLEKMNNANKVKALREQGAEAAADEEISYLKLYEHAHLEHQPQGRFSGGDVVVYRAMKGDGSVADAPYVEKFADPLLGWGPRVEGPVEAVDIPGGHSSMLQGSNVTVLAEHMRVHLARALGKLPEVPPVPLPTRPAATNAASERQRDAATVD
jgi:acyl transferase domain-containing protein/thioesterase domain-containing protein/acyl carrier protein